MNIKRAQIQNRDRWLSAAQSVAAGRRSLGLPDLWRQHMRLAFAAFILFLAALAAAPAVQAQETVLGSLALRDSDAGYDLGPYIYWVRDDGAQELSYLEVMQRYRSGQPGDMVRGDIVNLGPRPVRHWMIIPLSNESWTEDWMLSFGNHANGRLGQISDIFVYDAVSKVRYVDTVSAENNPYLTRGQLTGNALPLTIARGEKSLLVMRVEPEAGMPVLLAPRLYSTAEYISRQSSLVKGGSLMIGGFVAMIGFFMATVIMRQMWSSLGFIAYYVLLILLYSMQNQTVYTPFGFASEMFGLVFALVVVTGIYCSKMFLDIKRFYRVQNRAIAGFSIGIVAAALLAGLIIKDTTLAKPALIFLPPLLGLVFIILLGIAQAQSGKYAAYQYATSWVFVLLGCMVTALAVCGIIQPSAFTVGACWLGLVPQALMLVSATITRSVLQDRDEEMVKQQEESEAESIAVLKQSRDAAENARLLRVIEHERQVMNELRDREIKQSEEMRKARDSADEANRAKSAFLAVISHEIRTPMSGIMGMVRLLLDTKLSRDQKDYAQTIQESGDAMLALLNDILDFEKIESGKMDLEHINFDVLRLIQGVVTLMSGHAEAKGITLKSEIDPELPRYVIGDPVRLRQVILNLVGNSIKFTDRGGVTIHVKRDQAGDQRQGIVKIRIAVQDTGVGISREAQKNLFNPFAQADSSVARRFGGTGLGLAISQRLIEAMGGRIAIDSTEGRGSTFYFTLLLEEGAAEYASEAQGIGPVQPPAKALRILVVEDNEINQKLMKEFVQRLGHEVTIAGSGEAALEIYETQDFDMALMDMKLPGMSGAGTTKAIRALKNREKAALPVIAMTGNVRDEDIRNCFAANMNGHLAKPVDPQKLKENIQKVIDGKLDNPIELPEVEDYTQPEEVRISTQSAPQGTPDGDTAANELAIDSDDEGPAYEMAPLREMAIQGMSFELDDDDLDSDSFAEAMAMETAMEATMEMADDTGAAYENRAPIADAVLEEGGVSAPPRRPDSAVFDPEILRGLRDNMPEEAVRLLIEELLEKAEQIASDLDKAVSENNRAEIAARAHELKGMAANFGLREMSQLAARAETAADDDAMQDVDISAIVAGLPTAQDRARMALAEWLGERISAE